MDSALREQVLSLPEQDRILLLEELLDSLDPTSDGLDDDTLHAEVTRRSREVDDGSAELIPWSELKNESW